MSEYRRSDVDCGHGTERLKAFSDGVFSIAMTLLVLELRFPKIEEQPVGDRELWMHLLATTPRFASYVISFLVIGVYWMAHHNVFQIVNRYDRGLLFWNIIFLMFVAIVPFPLGLMSEFYYSGMPWIVYCAVTVAMGLSFVQLWRFARQRGLVDEGCDPRMLRYITARGWVVPIVFMISVAIVFIDRHLAQFAPLLIFPGMMLVKRLHRVKIAARA